MESIAMASFGIVILSLLFSIYLMLRPRHEEKFGLEKKWVCFGGIIVMLLATFVFYIAGYQDNNTVENFTLNGVTKTITTNRMDLPGQTYYLLINFAAIFSFFLYIICIVRETSLLGIVRQNKRNSYRT